MAVISRVLPVVAAVVEGIVVILAFISIFVNNSTSIHMNINVRIITSGKNTSTSDKQENVISNR